MFPGAMCGCQQDGLGVELIKSAMNLMHVVCESSHLRPLAEVEHERLPVEVLVCLRTAPC